MYHVLLDLRSGERDALSIGGHQSASHRAAALNFHMLSMAVQPDGHLRPDLSALDDPVFKPSF